MIRIALLFGFLGLAAATAILIWSGLPAVVDALRVAGWQGILASSLFHLVPMICCVIGWRALMPGTKRPSHGFFLFVLWLRTSVNNLMPVARIGGEIVAARVMMKYGVRQTLAISSTIVETTMSVIAVFLFDLLGVGLFALHVNGGNVVWQLSVGLFLSVPLIAAFVVVQRVGFFGLLDKVFTFMLRDKWKAFAGQSEALDRAVHVMYRHYGRVLYCGVWQFLSWVMGAGEIYLALYFLDVPFSLQEALMLEALIQASSSAAFAVPAAIGVQEGAFVLFGQMLGLPPEIAAAVAVMRRCRDLLLYVPGLMAWQIQEGHWLLKHRVRAKKR